MMELYNKNWEKEFYRVICLFVCLYVSNKSIVTLRFKFYESKKKERKEKERKRKKKEKKTLFEID